MTAQVIPLAAAAGPSRAQILATARDWWDGGFTVLPISARGEKRPIGNWKHYQSDRPDWPTTEAMFTGADTDGLCVLTGGARCLEMVEFEGRGGHLIEELGRLMADHGLGELWERLARRGYAEATPGGGVHLFYCVADGPVRSNTRLACRPASPEELAANPHDGVRVLIETRGEGGLVVIAPSGGRSHPTGRPWLALTGSATTVPTIRAHERDALHAIAYMLDRMPIGDDQADQADELTADVPPPRPREPGDPTRPGDDFNARATWDEVLVPHGWVKSRRLGPGFGWTRPGKTIRQGISATTDQAADGVSRLYVFSTSTPFEAQRPYDKFAAWSVLNGHGSDLSAAAAALRRLGYGEPGTDQGEHGADQGGDQGGDSVDKVSAATIVVQHVLAAYELGVTPSGEAYAVPRGGPWVPVLLHEKGGRLRDVVAADLFAATGRVIPDRALGDGLRVVVAQARTSAAPTPLHLRCALHGDGLVIDLAQPGSARCVVVTPTGWRVQDDPPAPILFRRSGATRPLPDPGAPGGTGLEELRVMLGFGPGDDHWSLTLGWLLAAPFAHLPRPLLAYLGPPGSGKSTRAWCVVSVLDPREQLGSTFGKSVDDDQVKALNRYLVGYDNLGKISDAVSDHVCRLVTGEESDKRRLYSDAELTTISYRRTGVVTAITLPGLRPDAVERIVPVHLGRLPEDLRRSESALRDRFTAAHPAILAGLLDRLVTALSRLPATRAQLRPRPRMADYADVLAAADPHLAQVYAAVTEHVMADLAADDPFIATLAAWLATVECRWTGPPEEAWRLAAQHRHRFDDGRSTWWPGSARAFTAALELNAEPLRAVGIGTQGRRSNGRRLRLFEPVDRPENGASTVTQTGTPQ